MYTQLDIAKGKLASGKRLNSTDKAALIAEARANGEPVPKLFAADVALTLVVRLIFAVFFLVMFASCAYALLKGCGG